SAFRRLAFSAITMIALGLARPIRRESWGILDLVWGVTDGRETRPGRPPILPRGPLRPGGRGRPGWRPAPPGSGVEGLVPVGHAVGLRRQRRVDVAFQLDGLDLVALLDRVDHFHAVGDLAEHGVLAVQPRARDMGDEELAAVGARARVGHGEHAALVAQAVVGLVLEAVAGAAGAGAVRAAALDHEVVDEAVEVQAVVEATPGQVGEVGDRQRGLLGLELDADRAAVGVEGGGEAHGTLRWGR